MIEEQYKDIEPDIVFALYMFLKNYRFIEPHNIFTYIKDQGEYLKSKFQEIEN